MADITYCGHYECTAKECMRHYDRAPRGQIVSWAMFDCPYSPVDEYEPVVHAHWEGDWCSLCGELSEQCYPRCPYCGAHMDEEVADV